MASAFKNLQVPGGGGEQQSFDFETADNNFDTVDNNKNIQNDNITNNSTGKENNPNNAKTTSSANPSQEAWRIYGIPKFEEEYLEEAIVVRVNEAVAGKIDAGEAVESHKDGFVVGGTKYNQKIEKLPYLVEAMNEKYKVCNVDHIIKVGESIINDNIVKPEKNGITNVRRKKQRNHWDNEEGFSMEHVAETWKVLCRMMAQDKHKVVYEVAEPEIEISHEEYQELVSGNYDKIWKKDEQLSDHDAEDQFEYDMMLNKMKADQRASESKKTRKTKKTRLLGSAAVYKKKNVMGSASERSADERDGRGNNNLTKYGSSHLQPSASEGEVGSSGSEDNSSDSDSDDQALGAYRFINFERKKIAKKADPNNVLLPSGSDSNVGSDLYSGHGNSSVSGTKRGRNGPKGGPSVAARQRMMQAAMSGKSTM